MRLFDALLHLCPASFRAEYGDEMYSIFAMRRREAANVFAVSWLWFDTIADILLTAIRTHYDVLQRDLSYATRTIRRSPGFAATVILVTALGIGATTAAYSLTDHVFRPLPFPEMNRLVQVWEDQSPQNYYQIEPSPANYRDWKRLNKSFEGMAAYSTRSLNLVGNGDPEHLQAAAVTSDLFPMLGAHTEIGRTFVHEDDRPGAQGTVILSYPFWQRRFGGDPDVVGRKVILDSEPFAVIGVMPREFLFPNRNIQIWMTLRLENRSFEDRGDNWLYVIAKLRPNVSLAQAKSEMRLVGAALERQYPKELEHVSVYVQSLRESVLEYSPQQLLLALLGASGCVLLIACMNIANLLLARALVRRKEWAVRAAMGAGAEQLVRQMLAESTLLAVIGGVLGILLAEAATPLLGRLIPPTLPISQTPTIDFRILLFAALLTILTAIVFGVFPAFRAARGLDVNGLREGGRSGVGGRRERLRAALVIAEVTASLVLLVSAGLLIRALFHVEDTNPGFRAGGVITMRTALPMPKYEKTSVRTAFYSNVIAAVKQLPGVQEAGYTSGLPMVMKGGIWPVTIEGEPKAQAGFHEASIRFVTPGFMRAMGIPLIAGRYVSDADAPDRQLVTVVSESFVREYWPHQNPLGRRFVIGWEPMRTVVGVVGNVRVRGLERTSEPQVYVPARQVADGSYPSFAPKDLVVRSSQNTGAVIPQIRRTIAAADPELPISDVQTLDEVLSTQTAPRRIQLRILGAFAAIALLLAGIGIHGLLSFAVSNRTQEFGVRVAVGATAGNILGLVMREGLLLATAGIIFGIALAYLAARSMNALLAGVEPTDWLTFSGSIAVVFAMTLLGSFFPALRATRVDAMTAIRAE